MKRHNALEGIKVLDFSWVIVGPYATRCMADYGAEVIRVESSTRPDTCRTLPPFKDHEIAIDNSGLYPNYNANKYGISLNLNHPKGRDIAKRLSDRADVVVESFTAGLMKRWGLAYEDIVQFNPSVIMVSLTMQGQTGPHHLHPGYGSTLQALTGFNHFLGWTDRPPCLPGVPYTDFVAPPFAVAAILAALAYRQRTGKGQYIDLSQYETGVHFLETAILDYTVNGRQQQRMGN
ncbi:MAG: CoA transferase, partial [Dehalococcoidia bacterium]|nr:CoA transferase [Dehalococcoidia bacterium]